MGAWHDYYLSHRLDPFRSIRELHASSAHVASHHMINHARFDSASLPSSYTKFFRAVLVVGSTTLLASCEIIGVTNHAVIHSED